MKTTLPLLLLFVLPFCLPAQTLTSCKDGNAFLIVEDGDFYCYTAFDDAVKSTPHEKIFFFHDHPIQTLIVPTETYKSNGAEDIPILSSYVVSETEYFSGMFKQELQLGIVPVKLPGEKTAVIWYYPLPKHEDPETPLEKVAVKQYAISLVLGNYVYTIASSLFADDDEEALRAMLSELARNTGFGNGKPNAKKLCKKH